MGVEDDVGGEPAVFIEVFKCSAAFNPGNPISGKLFVVSPLPPTPRVPTLQLLLTTPAAVATDVASAGFCCIIWDRNMAYWS